MGAALQLPMILPTAYAPAIRPLPKARAARLRWAVKQAEAAITSVAGAEDPRAALEDAAALFFRHSVILVTELLPLLGVGTPTPTQAMRRASARTERILAQGLGDPPAAGAFRWALDHVAAMSAHVTRVKGAGVIESARGLDVGPTNGVQSPMGAIVRAQVLALATIEAAAHDPPLPRAVELAWLAFEQTTLALDALGDDARSVVDSTSRAQGANAVLEAAQWAREALTRRDLRTLDAARLRKLR